jgi:hypothetical protein
LKNITIHEISQSWNEKISIEGLISLRLIKKLRVWQDAISLYILSCKIFTTFPFELKNKWRTECGGL